MTNRKTIRVSDDQGRTQDNWRTIDGPEISDWGGYNITEGATGNPVGRPKMPDDQVGASALRMRRFREHGPKLMTPFEGRTSTPTDWARERIEREEAAERHKARKRVTNSAQTAL